MNEKNKHVFNLFVVRTSNRDKLFDFLKENEICTGIHYPIPIHLQETYAHLEYSIGDFPFSKNI